MILKSLVHTSLPRKGTIWSALFAVAMLAGGPAATQGQPGGGQSADEIQLFCGNIVDPARERRYLIQKQELETLQAQVDERIAALEAKRAEYETWLKRRNTFLGQAEENLVSIVGRMRPDAAAGQLKELRSELAASILMKLDAKQASIILNEMDAKAAAALTTIIASSASPRDPS